MNTENLSNLFSSIDDKVVETWTEEKTIGDLLKLLTDDELKIFYKFKIVDCGLEKTEKIIDISLKIPSSNDVNSSQVSRIFIF